MESLWPTGGRDFPGLSFLAFSSDGGLAPYCPLGKGINVSVSFAQVPRPTYYTFQLIYFLLLLCEVMVIILVLPMRKNSEGTC